MINFKAATLILASIQLVISFNFPSKQKNETLNFTATNIKSFYFIKISDEIWS